MASAPAVLVNDPEMRPLVELLADQMATLYSKCSLPNIFGRIDDLPEGLLDILAQDFAVEWYDFNWAIDVKRATIRDSFYINRYKGTAGAVKRALADAWPSASIEEWFEYGGDPFSFRIIVAEEWSEEMESAIQSSVRHYKNERSHLDTITFNAGNATAPMYIAAAVCGIDIEDTVTMI